jgi:ribosomal subunit interface protein
VDIIFKGRHTEVLDRFRRQATEKLGKIGKLDPKAIRVDVEVTAEHNPRQAQRRERVELTISSRGPAIRAEAAAEDRYAALDIAFSKLESRLRRACDRRKGRHGAHAAIRVSDLPAADETAAGPPAAGPQPPPAAAEAAGPQEALVAAAADGESAGAADDVVPVKMDGSGPLVVREKFHGASPMTIDQALFEMELVGHDFFLYRDIASGRPSVVYRRRGYQYGVIRLVDEVREGMADAEPAAATPAGADGQDSRAAQAVAAGLGSRQTG